MTVVENKTAAGACAHCSYDPAAENAERAARGLQSWPRTMLLVDRHVQDATGRWGTWQGDKFIRGGGFSGNPFYWVCERCHQPGEAIQRVEKD